MISNKSLPFANKEVYILFPYPEYCRTNKTPETFLDADLQYNKVQKIMAGEDKSSAIAKVHHSRLIGQNMLPTLSIMNINIYECLIHATKNAGISYTKPGYELGNIVWNINCPIKLLR